MSKNLKLSCIFLFIISFIIFSPGCKKPADDNKPKIEQEPLFELIPNSKFTASMYPFITTEGNYLCFGNGQRLLRIDIRTNTVIDNNIHYSNTSLAHPQLFYPFTENYYINVEHLGDSSYYLSFFTNNRHFIEKTGSIRMDGFKLNGKLPNFISGVHNNNDKFKRAFFNTYLNEEKVHTIIEANINSSAIVNKNVIEKVIPLPDFKKDRSLPYDLEFYSFKNGYFILENSKGLYNYYGVLTFIDDHGNSRQINKTMHTLKVENDTAFLIDEDGYYRLKHSTDGINWVQDHQSDKPVFSGHYIKFMGNHFVCYSRSAPVKKLEVFDRQLKYITNINLDEPLSVHDLVEANGHWYIIGENGVYFMDLKKVSI